VKVCIVGASGTLGRYMARACARPRRRGGRSVVLDHRASLARRSELRFRCAFSTPARDARATRSPHWTKPLQMRGIGIPLREDARRCRRSSFLRGLPASGGSERLFPARDERGMKRNRRSFCAEPATENADLQAFIGSDGTRTRDLRRDRPVLALPAWAWMRGDPRRDQGVSQLVLRGLPGTSGHLLAEAGVELRQLALGYVEFVLLRFPGLPRRVPRPPPRRPRWRRRAGAVGGDARLSPSNYAHGRTGVKRRDPVRRATFGRRNCSCSPFMKISRRSRSRRRAAMADLMTSDCRVGPAIGLTWLPTVSH
jgi:hypothetical protein